ncbi:TIGR04282 family arsenosugar biosynthesis glycosyltransferase [Niallia sp. XMNu-256]|uniref:TIGR04282 family arsenosugar biosynthesis glycosyltransferase n=1 Tax=Niallia sp. XMNu-256 TaxID=3082444 RepID=UPI0030D327BA
MNALILMTRIPIPGKTKTRLMDLLTGSECAQLHMAFLKDLFATFEDLKDIDLFMTYTPEDSFFIIENMIPDSMKHFPQQGEDLGEKMFNAINQVFQKGYKKVILIGSDIPDLSAEDIQTSFKVLEECDLVLGPTYDGGYYLVGMKASNEKIFHIPKKWGGKSVLESTIEIGNEQDLSIGLSQKYRDIDTKEDLFEFERKNNHSKASNTMKWILDWRRKDAKRSFTRTN